MEDYDPDIDGLKDELRKLRYTRKWWIWVALQIVGIAIMILGITISFMALFDILFISPPKIQEFLGIVVFGLSLPVWYLAHWYHKTHFEEHLSAVMSLKFLEEQ